PFYLFHLVSVSRARLFQDSSSAKNSPEYSFSDIGAAAARTILAKPPLTVCKIVWHPLCTEFPITHFLSNDGKNRTEIHMHHLANVLSSASSVSRMIWIKLTHQIIRDETGDDQVVDSLS
ncbi:hypothetical protein CEXT_405551, partial [Caerostris extrusa]